MLTINDFTYIYRYIKTIKDVESDDELTLLYNLYNLGNE